MKFTHFEHQLLQITIINQHIIRYGDTQLRKSVGNSRFATANTTD